MLGSVTYVDNLALASGSGSGAPNAPTNLAANPLKTSANGGIELTWTDNSTDEMGFVVRRSTDGSTWTNVDSTAADVATFTDQGLTDGTQYYYQVLAYNASGNSAPSNTADATTTTVGIASVLPSNSLHLYPNPSTGLFHLELHAERAVNVMIYDISGKRVYEQRHESNGQLKVLLDLSKLDNGIYFMHVESYEGRAVQKIGITK